MHYSTRLMRDIAENREQCFFCGYTFTKREPCWLDLIYAKCFCSLVCAQKEDVKISKFPINEIRQV